MLYLYIPVDRILFLEKETEGFFVILTVKANDNDSVKIAKSLTSSSPGK